MSHDQKREWFGGSDGDVMTYDATNNKWGPVAPGGGGAGSGDVTGVSVSSPLTGGGTSGDVSIGLGTVPVSKGGTGATTAADARTNLGFTDWASFTPTCTWTSNVTLSGRWRRVGDSIDVDIALRCDGAPSPSANLAFDPLGDLGLTLDGTKLAASAFAFGPRKVAGSAQAIDQNTPSTARMCQVLLSHADGKLYVQVVTTAPNTLGSVTPTAPFTFAAGDYVYLSFPGIPVQ